jgi:UDP-3-O-[3-hydroxymyristoyl] glucosamine N-acyltransferase
MIKREDALRVTEIAEWLGLPWEGEGEREIDGVAPLDTAGPSELTFVSSPKFSEQAAQSAAGCLIVFPAYTNPSHQTLVRTPEPRAAFARVVARFHPPAAFEPGIHPSAVISPEARLDPAVSVGPHVTIGAGARIGSRSRIGAGCSLGESVTIGAECLLHPRVTLYPGVTVGDRAILHSGCVLGADGFGFALAGDHYEKFPQVGRVILGNDVEIGANSCVDRAALGVTAIGDGTKLDNLVHIGHNCRIGRHVVIAAQTGLSGGVIVEDYAVIGGQVGIGDKARIERGAVLGSGAGVLTSKIVRRGQVMWGTPARPLKKYLEILSYQGRLPSIYESLVEIQKRIAKLEGA